MREGLVTHRGGCHCGAVAFEVEAPARVTVSECNCSICCMSGYLHLIVPQRFFVHSQQRNGDRHLYASRTRFIPSALLEHFECGAWPPAVSQAFAKAKHTPVDLGARVRRSWG